MDHAIEEVILRHSQRMVDLAGREVTVLDEANAWRIADLHGRALHEIYELAMGTGILPKRYLRNRDCISLQDQLTLARSRVAVVGAGGLGGSVILLLARIGIGHLVVVDHDVFDETNLNRQALSNTAGMGKSKAVQAADTVAGINPAIRVTPHRVTLDPSNAGGILSGMEVVVDALDNVRARFTLQGATQELGIPLVHGAIAGFEGQMMTIFPGDGGMDLLYGTVEDEGNRSLSPEAILGVPALTPSLIATLQAMEVLKIVLHRGRVFRHTMLHVDLETGRLDAFSFEGS